MHAPMNLLDPLGSIKLLNQCWHAYTHDMILYYVCGTLKTDIHDHPVR